MGYFTKTQPAKVGDKAAPYGIMTFQWEDVQGKTRLLNGTVVCPENLAQFSYDESGTVFQEGWEKNAPQIQVRASDGGYYTCYWCADAWNNTAGVPMMGWADEWGIYREDIEIALGQGAWVIAPVEDCTFQIAGAVAGQEIDIGGDSTKALLLAGGGFPVAFNVNDTEAVTWTVVGAYSYDESGTVFQEGWEKNASQIQVRTDDGGYYTCYWCLDAWNNTENVPMAGWADEWGIYQENIVVGVGGGFWMTTPVGDKKIFVKVKNPIKK